MLKVYQKSEIKKLNNYIMEGNITNVETQIKKMKNINDTPYFFALDRINYPPLVLAAYQGELEICKILIAHGADFINVKGTKRASPLIASLYGNTNNTFEIARYFINLGADVQKKIFMEILP